MTEKGDLSEVVFRIKRMMMAVEETTEFSDLNLMARHLLDHIAGNQSVRYPLSVVEIMSLHKLGSPATLHKRLGELITAGLVRLDIDAKDNRRKFARLTPKAVNIYNRISAALSSEIRRK